MTYACEKCGHVGPATVGLVGSTKTLFWVFLGVGILTFGILWVVALVIYLAADKHAECGKCKAIDPVPIDTPQGKKMADAVGYVPSPSAVICRRCLKVQDRSPRCQCGGNSLVRADSVVGQELQAKAEKRHRQRQ